MTPSGEGEAFLGDKFHLAMEACCCSNRHVPKNACVSDQNDKTDLRLRLVSSTKLVISRNGHGSRHAKIGRVANALHEDHEAVAELLLQHGIQE
jgi:hypothetical protein